jgi:hypothetical protein
MCLPALDPPREKLRRSQASEAVGTAQIARRIGMRFTTLFGTLIDGLFWLFHKNRVVFMVWETMYVIAHSFGPIASEENV